MTKTHGTSILRILLLLPMSGIAAGPGDDKPDLEKQPTEKIFLASTPTNIVADALCAERLAAQRLKWTDDLRRRVDRFIEMSIHKAGDIWTSSCLEGEPKGWVDMPALGFVETNCYAIAPLLSHTNEFVRQKVILYYIRARRVGIKHAEQAGRLIDFEKGNVPGAPWVSEVLNPLVARSLFDQNLIVRCCALHYSINNLESHKRLAGLARAQGTNEWAMEQWVYLYNSGSNLVPYEIFEDVRKVAEAAKEAEDRRNKEMLELDRKDKKELEERKRNK